MSGLSASSPQTLKTPIVRCDDCFSHVTCKVFQYLIMMLPVSLSANPTRTNSPHRARIRRAPAVRIYCTEIGRVREGQVITSRLYLRRVLNNPLRRDAADIFTLIIEVSLWISVKWSMVVESIDCHRLTAASRCHRIDWLFTESFTLKSDKSAKVKLFIRFRGRMLNIDWVLRQLILDKAAEVSYSVCNCRRMLNYLLRRVADIITLMITIEVALDSFATKCRKCRFLRRGCSKSPSICPGEKPRFSLPYRYEWIAPKISEQQMTLERRRWNKLKSL